MDQNNLFFFVYNGHEDYCGFTKYKKTVSVIQT